MSSISHPSRSFLHPAKRQLGLLLAAASLASPALAQHPTPASPRANRPAVVAEPRKPAEPAKLRAPASASEAKWSARAEGWVALRASTGLAFRPHDSMDLYTRDNSLRARGAGLGVDVWRHLRLALAVEADWTAEKASSAGVLGGGFNGFYKLQQGNLGVSLRHNLGGLHPALALLSPHLRLYGSVAATKQRLRDSASGIDYRTPYAATGGAGAALGFTLRTPALLPLRDSSKLALSLGLRVEAGYAFMSDPEFVLDPVDDSKHSIRLRGASLGTLELDAAFLRASLELRL